MKVIVSLSNKIDLKKYSDGAYKTVQKIGNILCQLQFYNLILFLPSELVVTLRSKLHDLFRPRSLV